MRDNLEGYIIGIYKKGEYVEGKIKKCACGRYYNIQWENSDGQSFIGRLEDWEIEKAIREGLLF